MNGSMRRSTWHLCVNGPIEVEAGEECPLCGTTPAAKDDGAKPRYDLLPLGAIALLVDVLTYGAKKYAPDAWRKVDGWRWRYYAAALRHLFAWYRGERIDPESGLPHLGHVLCCVAFLAEKDCLQTSEPNV